MIEHKITVTVLVATYNGEKFLKAQIDSLLVQKNVNVRILVRDDTSKDRTTEILDNYKRRGCLDWYSGSHLGVEKNFLDLMKHAPSADYYAFCDQDDVWDQDKLYNAVIKLEQLDNSKPALYYSSLKLVNSDLRYISTHRANIERSDHGKFIFCGIAGCTMVFNNALLNMCNKANPKFLRMHDIWLFNVCLAMGGSYYADYEAFINYRQHGNNTVGLKKSSWLDSYKTYVEKSRVSEHIQSLLECYKDDMIAEYQAFCKLLVDSNSSLASRIKLLTSDKIKFNNAGLNLIFKMKVILRKM